MRYDLVDVFTTKRASMAFSLYLAQVSNLPDPNLSEADLQEMVILAFEMARVFQAIEEYHQDKDLGLRMADVEKMVEDKFREAVRSQDIKVQGSKKKAEGKAQKRGPGGRFI